MTNYIEYDSIPKESVVGTQEVKVHTYQYQSIGFSLFDAFIPNVAALGIKPEPTWRETRAKLANLSRAILARRDIRPETRARWERAASLSSV